MTMYWVLFIAVAIASFAVQQNLQRKFSKYSEVPLPCGLTGRDVALKMLHDNGITDIRVTCIEGQLTDHYDPVKKTVNLSTDVYNGRNITSAAVAAHECGHAVQHADGYVPVKMRSSLVPVVQFASTWVTWVLLAGMILINYFPGIMLAGILLFAMTTLFSFVTLPVEIDASRRAIGWMTHSGLVDGRTVHPAEESLRAAAYTYVVAALSSLGTLLYYVMIFMGRRN
ncbi:MAG: zinc metallopeptidase [Bacteroidaceae bacterium]|nr:zinc metallopeptidase [Bacteroidaceae bacterium]